MQNIFGEVIYSYTRKQAIEDGVLVDVTKQASEAGFKYHTVVTSSVFEVLNKGDLEGRLWDVLNCAMFAVRSSIGMAKTDTRIEFGVKIGRKNERLLIDCGPGDQGEPVLTIGYSEDF